MHITYAVMHTPERTEWLNKICIQLPEYTIVTNEADGYLWKTAKEAWNSYTDKATHHCVIQDDVQLCGNFHQTVEKLVSLKLDVLLGLYHNYLKVDDEAIANRIRWIKLNGAITAQALLLPVKKIKEFMTWERNHILPEYRWDDGRLQIWQLKTKAIESWFCLPTLVEHMAPNNSIANVSNKNKVSRWAVTPDIDATYFDWTEGIETPIVSNQISMSKNAQRCYYD